jgi:hypothetical protein
MENLAKFCMIKHKTNVRMFSDYARRSLRENKNKIPRSTAKQVSGKDKKKSYMSKKNNCTIESIVQRSNTNPVSGCFTTTRECHREN